MAEGGRTNDPLEETSTWPAVESPPMPADADDSPFEAAPAAAEPATPSGTWSSPPEPAAPVAPLAPPPPGSTSGARWGAPPPAGVPWRPGRSAPPKSDDNGARILGVILIVVGAWLLLRRYIDFDTELVLPIIAIALGGLLLATGLRPRGRNG